MTIQESHKSLMKNFVYTADPEDYWKLWSKDETVYDDCDGFSLNLIYRHFGKFWWPLIKKDATLYFVKFNEVGHMVVKIDGYYCDNILQVPVKNLDGRYRIVYSYGIFNLLVNKLFVKSEWLFKLEAKYPKYFKYFK